MSYFGRNIKKIRTAKNISQTAFADLFKLKRGSIGAYEEGRAEAKIDTIIEIAEYFQLTLDQLLKKELTINDIYHIKEISKKIELQRSNNDKDIDIPLVRIADREEFIKKFNNHTYLQGLNTIKLPGLLKDSIALEFKDSGRFSQYAGLKTGDLLIAQKATDYQFELYIKNQLFIVLSKNEIYVSRITTNSTGLTILSDNQDIMDLDIQFDSISAIWKIYQVISNKIPTTDQVEVRLQNIENQLNKIINKNCK